MKNPYKIIHKFKNNNNSTQFKIFIFVGPMVDDNVMKALNSFKNKDFYNTITTISKANLKLLETEYGPKWYNKFFTINHILLSLKNISGSPTKRKAVISKLGKEWYNGNIDVKSKDVLEKKIPFSFSANYHLNFKDVKTTIREASEIPPDVVRNRILADAPSTYTG